MQVQSMNFKARATENNVVALPDAGRSTGIHERRVLSVQGSGLSVGVREVVVRVEDLHFVHAHKKDATIAAILIGTVRRIWRHPLNV